MNKLALFLILLPSVLYGQNVTFSIDSLRGQEELQQMEWKIKGQRLNSENKTITVPISKNKLDTIYYKERENTDWLPLICKITEPNNYTFRHNACCGAFNVFSKNHVCTANVVFKTTSNSSKQTFIGLLDETAMLVTSTDTINPICKSVMSPNMCHLKFGKFKLFKDSSSLGNQFCLYEKKEKWIQTKMDHKAHEKTIESDETIKTINFDFTSILLDIFYIPLDNSYLEINFNAKKGIVSIK